MIVPALVAGLAGLWLWVVLNDEGGIFGFVPRLAAKTEYTRKWLSCPWCSGAWFSGLMSVALWHPSVIPTIITALAAAAITGLVGSYLEGG